MFRRIAHWLRHSPHVHIRQGGVQSLSDLVELIDRFVDDELRYVLEWDDFISWDHSTPEIEAIRARIAATEPLFFSKDPEKVAHANELLLEQRNQAALLAGKAVRTRAASDAA
jgi:hypothetical protein